MSNRIPLAVADLELQLATTLAVGGTSFTLSGSTDDDGTALPAGMYCFTVDNGTSNKEYLLGQVNGTAVTSVVSVSRQGVETSGAARKHRIGAPIILTDFATIQRVADILRGQLALDGANPVGYDAEPTLADRKDLATVGYVLDTVTGGTVAFDSMVVTGNGGEAIVADNLVYFKTSDQEWYKTDADTAATVEGVQLGIAKGTGSDGVSITGGVQIAGVYTTTGLTAGALYYAGNTAGAISSSAGTTSRVIGIALSTTKLLIIPRNPQDIKDAQKDALAGGGDFGTPGTSNKFVTQSFLTSASVPTPQVVVFTASGTWTKDAGLRYIVVEGVGGGGGCDTNDEGGGSGGGYFRKLILAAALGATETVTVGAAGSSDANATIATAGGNTSFGTHCTGNGGARNQGAGGTATGGDINISGQNGVSGSTGTGGNYSIGGSSMLGLGGISDTATPAGYGAGGNGPHAATAGVVIVTEYYS